MQPKNNGNAVSPVTACCMYQNANPIVVCCSWFLEKCGEVNGQTRRGETFRSSNRQLLLLLGIRNRYKTTLAGSVTTRDQLKYSLGHEGALDGGVGGMMGGGGGGRGHLLYGIYF